MHAGRLLYPVVLFCITSWTVVAQDGSDEFTTPGRPTTTRRTTPGCMTEPNISNAIITTNSPTLFTTVNITCREGFRMTQILSCDSDNLKYEDTECRPVECPLNPVIRNGDLTFAIGSRVIGVKYNFRCKRPFTKQGRGGTIICNTCGEWETDITCVGPCQFQEVGCQGFPPGYAPIVKTREYSRTACETSCNNNPRCTTWSFLEYRCKLYTSPVIMVIGGSLTRAKCQQLCAFNRRCLSVVSTPTECALFDKRQLETSRGATGLNFYYSKIDEDCE
ncbi:hypothetical protein LOTGIDRAFT_234333 [Lottia gigantea]|uniref:Sushi domain-containing protein n=1 Tax=Lottia gigantea TaxID=225164 RepID=V4BLH8_LOTGI|nr:hypothetical protein LOTGIDRAFT_234333 [Lottia gigantea]ESO89524.1 hypothetical protein LOTGIDRAFT_234333 [Lottia gigantea]